MPVVPKLSIVRVQVLENPDKLVEFRGDLHVAKQFDRCPHLWHQWPTVEFSLFTPRCPPDSVDLFFWGPTGDLHMALGHWARWWLLPFFCTGCVALV